jgi:hypothetical protein
MNELSYVITLNLNVCQRLVDSSTKTDRPNGRQLPQSCIKEFLPLLEAQEDRYPIQLNAYNPCIYPFSKKAGVNFLKLQAFCKECQLVAADKKTPNGKYTIIAKNNPFKNPIILPEDRKTEVTTSKKPRERVVDDPTTQATVTYTAHVHERPRQEKKVRQQNEHSSSQNNTESSQSDQESDDSAAASKSSVAKKKKPNEINGADDDDDDDDDPDRSCSCHCCSGKKIDSSKHQLREPERTKAVMAIIIK